MPEFTFYSAQHDTLLTFVRGLQRIHDERDLAAWDALVTRLETVSHSQPRLNVPRGQPTLGCWLEELGRIKYNAGLPDLTKGEIPNLDSPSLSYLLKRLTLLSARYVLRGYFGKFNGFFATDLRDKAVFKAAGWHEEYKLFLDLVFRSRRPFLPELAFLDGPSGSGYRSYLLPEEIGTLLESEERLGMLRSLRGEFLTPNDRELSSDFGRLIPFLSLLKEERLAVYYEEGGT